MVRTRDWVAAVVVATSFLSACQGGDERSTAGLDVRGDGEAPCARFADKPWCDARLDPEVRAERLMAALTLEEKIGLMAGDTGEGEAEGYEQGIPRLGVPALEFTDGPPGVTHDVASGVPQSINVAATFDPDHAAEVADIVASEVRAYGLNGWLAPSFDLLRQPLYDRAADTYGESPAVVTAMNTASIQAAQQRGVLATTKHYLAFTQETGRVTTPVFADERVLRELYLPPVEAAVRDADVDGVMISYNLINEERVAESQRLIREVLFDEYGFGGFTMSDFFVGITNGLRSIQAGVNLEMPQALHYTPAVVRGYIEAGLIDEGLIDDAAGRILTAMFKRGLFERADSEPVTPNFAVTGPRLREMATKGITLLRNDDLLPLDLAAIDRIAVIGAPATEINRGGRAGEWPYGVTILQGLRNVVGDTVALPYDDGSDAVRAAAAAADADVAIVVAADSGDGDRLDRTCLSLSPPCAFDRNAQDALIAEVAEAQPRTVVILNTAGPVLTPWRDSVAALIWAGRPGMEAGHALADILIGDAEPGGRLPFTMMAEATDSPTDPVTQPLRYPVGNYSEGVLNGFRHYDAEGLEVAYPFGHGMGYTDFVLDALDVSVTPDGGAEVAVDVRNTGGRDGAHVVQVYVGLPQDVGPVQPPRWLRAFQRVSVPSGATKTVRMTLPPRAFSYWDSTEAAWIVASGCHRVEVGHSSRHLPLRRELAMAGGSCAQ